MYVYNFISYEVQPQANAFIYHSLFVKKKINETIQIFFINPFEYSFNTLFNI